MQLCTKKMPLTNAQKIKQLDEPLRAKLAQIPEAQRWLVTSEGAFSYLAKDYNLKEVTYGQLMLNNKVHHNKCVK